MLHVTRPPSRRVRGLVGLVRRGSSAIAAVGLLGAGWSGVSVELAPTSGAATPPRAVDPPFEVTEQLTDRVGVLGGEIDELRDEVAELRDEHGIQLFAVFVESFDGAYGDEWAQTTYEASGMGGDDVLLAVAVADGRYSTWATTDSGLTPEEDDAVRADFIEPALADGDWAGAVRGAVEGYGDAADEGGTSSGEGTGFGVGLFGSGGGLFCCLLVPVGAVLAMASRRRRRPRAVWSYSAGGPTAGRPIVTTELEQQAAAALVALDNAARSSAEELAFAEAQFGRQATRPFRDALETAQQHATRAFELRRSIDDARAAGSRDESTERAQLREILALAAEVDRTLDAKEAEFARLRDLESRVPQFLDELGARLRAVRPRLPVGEQELTALTAQYPPEALTTIRGNVEQADSLLASVDGFLTRGREELAAGNRPGAVAAARAAEDAIGQAEALLGAVSRARDELAAAPGRVEQALASLSADVADAERLGADDQPTVAALLEARSAIEQGAAVRDGKGDPVAVLRRLVRAEQALDNCLARYRDPRRGGARGRGLLEERITQIGALLEDTDAMIQANRGAIGPEARTHVAEARRLYGEALGAADHDSERTCALLDDVEDHTELALALAQADIDSWSGYGTGFPGSVSVGFGGIHPGSLVLGGILGGVLWGGLSGGFGGSRGGGWGGSGGGFGDGGDLGGGGRF